MFLIPVAVVGYKVYEHRKKVEEAKKLQEPGKVLTDEDIKNQLTSDTDPDTESDDEVEGRVKGPLAGFTHFINKHVLLEDYLVEEQRSSQDTASNEDVTFDEHLELTEDDKYAVMGNQGHATVPLPQLELK